MEYIKLGNTDIFVSRLCFGGLVLGPLQAGLSIEEAAEVISSAFELGVNFIDTAELYGTYPHINKAIKLSGKHPIIATKSYAYDREGAIKSVEKARKELDIDVIDIFLMHEQESRLTLRGHREALEYYLEAKEKGIIRAVGVSTHFIEVVEAAADMPEIDIIHPLVNKSGIGICDGSVDKMLHAIKYAHSKGKGIYSMKALGGGNLLHSYQESLRFVLDIPFIHSVAIGMQSKEEVLMNIKMFDEQEIPEDLLEAINSKKKRLHIEYWCEGCGECVKRCKQKALILTERKACVDMKKCVLCGYCGSSCKAFAIKIC